MARTPPPDSPAQAGEADFVVLAVNWTRALEALAALPPLPGRILVDASNQWAEPPTAAVVDSLEVSDSELVASLAPEDRVIKAFDNLYGPTIAADPITPARRRILFHAGDDTGAKRCFSSEVEQFGFVPVDLAPLRMGGSCRSTRR